MALRRSRARLWSSASGSASAVDSQPGGNLVAMTTCRPSASSPKRRSDAPPLYMGAVSNRSTPADRLAPKARASSSGPGFRRRPAWLVPTGSDLRGGPRSSPRRPVAAPPDRYGPDASGQSSTHHHSTWQILQPSSPFRTTHEARRWRSSVQNGCFRHGASWRGPPDGAGGHEPAVHGRVAGRLRLGHHGFVLSLAQCWTTALMGELPASPLASTAIPARRSGSRATPARQPRLAPSW
jgi:hypothetical protein